MSPLQRIIAAVAGLGIFGGLFSFFGVGLPKESSALSVRLESAALRSTRTHSNTGSSFGK
jgi:hypothetical protein